MIRSLQRSALVLATAAACSGRADEPRATEQPPPLPRATAVVHDAAPDAAAIDAGKGLAIIDARAAQRSAKMKLTAEQARAARTSLVEELERSAPLRRLHSLMPHSTVELCRAIRERGVAPGEVDRIARYLAHLAGALEFGNLRQFDINHSHVTGREWHEIDYSGESMTWQGQKKYWTKKGVGDFKTAEHVHAYMRHAFELPHFARIYRPRGSFAGVEPP